MYEHWPFDDYRVFTMDIEALEQCIPQGAHSCQIVGMVQCMPTGVPQCQANKDGNVGTGNVGRNNYGNYNFGNSNIGKLDGRAAAPAAVDSICSH